MKKILLMIRKFNVKEKFLFTLVQLVKKNNKNCSKTGLNKLLWRLILETKIGIKY